MFPIQQVVSVVHLVVRFAFAWFTYEGVPRLTLGHTQVNYPTFSN